MVTVARAAEEIGYDGVWVFERVLVPENPDQGLYGIPNLAWPDYYRSVADPLVTLAAAAAVTERVRLGSAVLIAPLHQPFQLARGLATLDAVSAAASSPASAPAGRWTSTRPRASRRSNSGARRWTSCRHLRGGLGTGPGLVSGRALDRPRGGGRP